MLIVKAAVLYFTLVFGTGFVLGTIRTLWVVPRLGTRTAELLEAPFMLVATVVAAQWTVARLAVPSVPSARLGILVLAEFGPMLWLRGLSIRDYLAKRDPVSGTVYYAMLVVFAIMPLLVSRR